MRWLAVAVLGLVLGACGRFGFEPRDASEQTSSGDGNGGGSSDGAPGDGVMPDTQPAACAGAMTATVGMVTVSTCGTGDNFDGCATVARQEIVFKFTPPATGGYTIAAYDTGTLNVSNSTARVDAACTGYTNCAAVLGTSLTAGVDAYFVVEASSSACVTVDFTIQ